MSVPTARLARWEGHIDPSATVGGRQVDAPAFVVAAARLYWRDLWKPTTLERPPRSLETKDGYNPRLPGTKQVNPTPRISSHAHVLLGRIGRLANLNDEFRRYGEGASRPLSDLHHFTDHFADDRVFAAFSKESWTARTEIGAAYCLQRLLARLPGEGLTPKRVAERAIAPRKRVGGPDSIAVKPSEAEAVVRQGHWLWRRCCENDLARSGGGLQGDLVAQGLQPPSGRRRRCGWRSRGPAPRKRAAPGARGTGGRFHE